MSRGKQAFLESKSFSVSFHLPTVARPFLSRSIRFQPSLSHPRQLRCRWHLRRCHSGEHVPQTSRGHWQSPTMKCVPLMRLIDLHPPGVLRVALRLHFRLMLIIDSSLSRRVFTFCLTFRIRQTSLFHSPLGVICCESPVVPISDDDILCSFPCCPRHGRHGSFLRQT